MRTYIVYRKDEEVFRGTIPDCCAYVEDFYSYSLTEQITFVVMLPNDTRYDDLTESIRRKMFSKLDLQDRLKLNAFLKQRLAA